MLFRCDSVTVLTGPAEFLIRKWMGRKAEMKNGKVQTFWLGEVHLNALDSYRRRHRARSRGDALRKVLEVVAEVERSNAKEETAENP